MKHNLSHTHMQGCIAMNTCCCSEHCYHVLKMVGAKKTEYFVAFG
jgi:hypothetical protein